MGSRSVLGAARADIADAMDRAEHDGPTLLTGAVPSPEGMRRSYCEILWEQQQRRFMALALQQGIPEEEGVSSNVYVLGVYEEGVYA